MKVTTRKTLFVLKWMLFLTILVMITSIFFLARFNLSNNSEKMISFVLSWVTNIMISLVCGVSVSYITIHYQSCEEYQHHISELIRITRSIKRLIHRCDQSNPHEVDLARKTICDLLDEFEYMRSLYTPLQGEDELAKNMGRFHQERDFTALEKAIQEGVGIGTRDNAETNCCVVTKCYKVPPH